MHFSSSAWNYADHGQPYSPGYPPSPAQSYASAPNAPPYPAISEYSTPHYYSRTVQRQVFQPLQSPTSSTKYSDAQEKPRALLAALRAHQVQTQESKPEKKKKKKWADAPMLPPYNHSERCPESKVHYVRDAAEADRAIDELRAAVRADPLHNQIIGFDLEWKPRFKKGQPENPVALVQLASRDVIVLAQVTAMSRELFSTKERKKVIHIVTRGFSLYLFG